jgi:hypothetical protein
MSCVRVCHCAVGRSVLSGDRRQLRILTAVLVLLTEAEAVCRTLGRGGTPKACVVAIVIGESLERPHCDASTGSAFARADTCAGSSQRSPRRTSLLLAVVEPEADSLAV